MRLIVKSLICLCLLSGAVFSQERISKVMVGSVGGDGGSGSQTRIVVSFIEQPSEDSYKLQSMIINLDPVKNKKESPSAFFVDLTSTVRNLVSNEKKQKILLLQWKKPGAIELKCDGKWKKQDAGNAALEKIVEVIQAVIRSVPPDAKAPTEATLPEDVEEKVYSILNSLQTENPPCLRSGS